VIGSLGTGEILVICAIALIVVGPQRLVAVAGTLGRMWGELRRKMADAQRAVEREIDLAGEREALKKIEENNRRIMIETGVLDARGEPPAAVPPDGKKEPAS
jgi:Sec-independent protein translocase protein TatA